MIRLGIHPEYKLIFLVIAGMTLIAFMIDDYINGKGEKMKRTQKFKCGYELIEDFDEGELQGPLLERCPTHPEGCP